MQTVTVTIGRNIGETPMRKREFDTFQSAALAILSLHTTGQTWIETHIGQGTWLNEAHDVIQEESAKITILGVESKDMAAIQLALSVLADTYEQDAIALSFGESVLVQRATSTVKADIMAGPWF